MLPGDQHQVVVDVDRDDVATLADDMRDERRVVAGAGPNFENALIRVQGQLLEHDRHDRWLR